ncbi:hypothetical protein [Bradyrhizobium sediminis]|nr:hypothetical protein [Bradyrhizobium sediminis]
MTEPPDDTYAGSLISDRGYFRFSSIDVGLGWHLLESLAPNPE